ncbi:MAG TPA: hypothetical protein VFH85_04500 [Gammaproteobacteria bacterium]|nr:hypothetical protein [Gammaproteobacteria bacterium]
MKTGSRAKRGSIMSLKERGCMLLAAILCIFAPLTAAADGGATTPGDEIGKLYTVTKTLAPVGSNPVGGHVDLASGQLSIREVDVSIPGNSELPVEFARTFSPDGHAVLPLQKTNNGELHDWRIDVPKIYAVLATQNKWPNNRCSGFGPPPYATSDEHGGFVEFEPSSYWHGYYVHLPRKGTQQLLRAEHDVLTPGDIGQYPIVTNNYWAVECRNIGGVDANGEPDDTPGEGFTLHTPDGLTYYFDHMRTEHQPALQHNYDHAFENIIYRARYVMLASRVEDTFGNWVKYKYNSFGELTSIQANDGRLISVSYNGQGRVGSVTANGKTWTYSYFTDAAGHRHLQRVTLPDGRHWQFALSQMFDDNLIIADAAACDGPGRPGASTSGTGSVTSPFGAEVTFHLAPMMQGRANIPKNCWQETLYDPVEAKTPKEYYTLALLSKTISGPNMASMKWTYSYSQTHGWYSEETPGATHKWTKVVDPDGGKTVYWFNINVDWREGNLDWVDYYLHASDTSRYRRVTNDYSLRSIQAGISRQMWTNQHRTQAIIRSSGEHIAQDGASYNWEVTSWDDYDNPLVRREYNSAGDELTKQYTYENRVSDWWLGQLKSVTVLGPADVAGLKPYEATYGTNGRIASVTKFGRLVGTYGWSPRGHLILITDPAGYKTQLDHYHRGRPGNITFPDGGAYTLDINDDGTIASLTNTRGYLTAYSYDALGRLQKITYPTNDDRTWDSTTFDLTVSGSLTVGGVRRTRTTGSSAETTYYDVLLRPILTRRGPSGAGTYVRREFDSAGHKIFESYPSTSREAPDGIHYEYDGLGRLTKVVRDTENGDTTEAIQYSANKRTVTDARGNVTTYTYRNLAAPNNALLMSIEAAQNTAAAQTTTINRDGLGAMTSVTRSGGSIVPQTREYIYNTSRELCMVVDPETGLTVMHYDNRGLMDWQAKGISSSSRDCATVSVPADEKAIYTYDPKRRLTNIDYPGTANDIVKGYDTEDNITTLANGPVVWTYAYNGRNLLKSGSLTLDGRTFNVDSWYNSRGQLWDLAYPNTETVVFSPDAFGRPTQVGGVVSDVAYYANDAVASYTYANGTTMHMTENLRRLPAQLAYPGINTWRYGYDQNANLTAVDWSGPSGAPNEDRSGFEYDALNRLTAVNGPWGASAFTYDALDNLRTKQYGSRSQTYTYDADNRLMAITGGLSYTLDYDAQGNIVQRNGDTFTFDQANRMTSSDKGGSYVYDGWGRRVKVTAPGGEITYTVYSRAGQLLQEYKPAVNKRTDYLYLGDKLVAEKDTLAIGPAGAGSLTVAAGDGVDGNYTLNWSAIGGASYYWLTEKQADGSWATLLKGAALTKGVSGKIGGEYDYRLAGCSGTDCATGASLTVGVAPTVPALTVPSGTQNGSYTVRWTAPVSATYYDLQEYKNGTWTTVENNTGSTSTTRPRVGGSYQYRVRAYNQYGTRGYTATSAVVKVLPPVPASLTATDTTSVNSYFTLNWSASAGATSYTLVRRKQNSDGSWSGWTWYSPTTARSRGFGYHELSDGAYQFMVRADTGGVGSSGWRWGPTVQVEWRPPAPALSAPMYADVGEIYNVSWSRPSGVKSFHLHERHLLSTGAWSTWITYDTTATHKGFIKSTGTFEYQVQGCKTFVCSNYSSIKKVTVGAGSCPAGTTSTNSPAAATSEKQSKVTPQIVPTC